MFSSSKKPYTAVTVQIERLTSPEHEENDFSGIVDLIDVIRIQDTGPTEAARALRKKLKYGSPHRQLRALAILDGLIQNAGGRFQRTFIDEPLLERLRMLPQETMTDAEVRDRCNTLYRQWAVAYRNTPGLSGIASLHKELPRRKKQPSASQSRVIRENDAEAQENPFGTESDNNPPASPLHERKRSYSRPTPNYNSPSTSSASRPRAQSSGSIFSTNSGTTSSNRKDKDKSSRSSKYKPFNLEKEKPTMMQAIANSSITSTNLLNALKFVNRENSRVSQDPNVIQCFQSCKSLRRQILRYIQLVESDQWIGSLLSANDDLVNALMTFEIMDKSIDDDSDSENEGVGVAASPTMGAGGFGVESGGLGSSARKMSSPGSPTTMTGSSGSRVFEQQMAGLSIMEQPPAKPPRPGESSLKKNSLKAPPPPAVDHQTDSEMEDAGDENDPFGDHNAIKS